MIDHTGVTVTDYARSKRFYEQALGAIGYALLLEVPKTVTGSSDVAGTWPPPAAIPLWPRRAVGAT